MIAGELVMAKLRPFWGSASVLESNATEEERSSGIVIPTAFEGDGGHKRGVVLHVGPPLPGYPDASEHLRPGTVVFYRGGQKIGDVTVVALTDVLAYED